MTLPLYSRSLSFTDRLLRDPSPSVAGTVERKIAMVLEMAKSDLSAEKMRHCAEHFLPDQGAYYVSVEVTVRLIK